MFRLRRAVMPLLVAVVGACGSGGPGSGSTTVIDFVPPPVEPTTTTTSATLPTTTTAAALPTIEARVYFLRGETVWPFSRLVPRDATVAGAVRELLRGPSDAETALGAASAVPDGVVLHGVSIINGVATIDVSAAFGSGGGSASMTGRVAQVVFTATQFPDVDSVAFAIDGTNITVLGGEGLVLDHPQTRADWESRAPGVLLEAPLAFADVHSLVHLTGTANTFEALFLVRLTDGAGRVVYDHATMASSGTGTRGTFDLTVSVPGASPGSGTITVYEESGLDGSPINIVDIPVRWRA